MCVCLPVCRVVGIFVSTGGEDGTVGINTIANEYNTTVIFKKLMVSLYRF